jgi:DNA polymerase III subunit alpha
LADLRPDKNQSIVVAGLVVDVRIKRTKRGDKMAIITLDDRSARIELAIFSDTFETYQALIEVDQILIVEGETSIDNFTGNSRIITRKLLTVAQAREQFAKSLTLMLHQQQLNAGFWETFTAQLKLYKNGNCRLKIIYQRPDAKATLHCGEEWRIQLKEELLAKLTEMVGAEQLRVEYK